MFKNIESAYSPLLFTESEDNKQFQDNSNDVFKRTPIRQNTMQRKKWFNSARLSVYSSSIANNLTEAKTLKNPKSRLLFEQ